MQLIFFDIHVAYCKHQDDADALYKALEGIQEKHVVYLSILLPKVDVNAPSHKTLGSYMKLDRETQMLKAKFNSNQFINDMYTTLAGWS